MVSFGQKLAEKRLFCCPPKHCRRLCRLSLQSTWSRSVQCYLQGPFCYVFAHDGHVLLCMRRINSCTRPTTSVESDWSLVLVFAGDDVTDFMWLIHANMFTLLLLIPPDWHLLSWWQVVSPPPSMSVGGNFDLGFCDVVLVTALKCQYHIAALIFCFRFFFVCLVLLKLHLLTPHLSLEAWYLFRCISLQFRSGILWRRLGTAVKCQYHIAALVLCFLSLFCLFVQAKAHLLISYLLLETRYQFRYDSL